MDAGQIWSSGTTAAPGCSSAAIGPERGRTSGPAVRCSPPLIAVINAVPVADDRHEIVAPTGRLRGSMVPLTV